MTEETGEAFRRTSETALPVVASLDELERYVLQEPEVCLRWSEGPRADSVRPSVDKESGLLLPGLPVTPLRAEPWWTRDRRDWISRQLFRRVGPEGGNGRAWLLIGRVAGSGPDREPLLWPWTPVAVLSARVLEQARERYTSRFLVGASDVQAMTDV